MSRVGHFKQEGDQRMSASKIALRFDPYRIFHGSRTPMGLYARQKWLQEASNDRWRSDFDATVSELRTVRCRPKRR